MLKKVKKHIELIFTNRSRAVYFDYFGIEYIPQEILKKIRDRSITHNIFRIFKRRASFIL